jgi:hypothetical protein
VPDAFGRSRGAGLRVGWLHRYSIQVRRSGGYGASTGSFGVAQMVDGVESGLEDEHDDHEYQGGRQHPSAAKGGNQEQQGGQRRDGERG